MRKTFSGRSLTWAHLRTSLRATIKLTRFAERVFFIWTLCLLLTG